MTEKAVCLPGGVGTPDYFPRFETGTSIFDPVLCELVYRWFCPSGGLVLDPFAGGSVRGIVANKLSRGYVGIELRPEQIASNREQAERICTEPPMPTWVEGDAAKLADLRLAPGFDFLFSCPPYGDLERYSDDPRDLSTMPYTQFIGTLANIISASAKLLKPDRFACFVVGDFRDKDGNYRNFVGDTVSAFRRAGLHLYNEAVLLTAIGSLPVRAGRQFSASRKLGKTHQNVLVFVRGDGKHAAKACGDITVTWEGATNDPRDGRADSGVLPQGANEGDASTRAGDSVGRPVGVAAGDEGADAGAGREAEGVSN